MGIVTERVILLHIRMHILAIGLALLPLGSDDCYCLIVIVRDTNTTAF